MQFKSPEIIVVEKIKYFLNEQANWVNLHRRRNSFLTKTFTVISIVCTASTMVELPVLSSRIPEFQLALILIGAALFLIGYLTSGLLSPPEFYDNKSVEMLIDDFEKVATDDFVIGRASMLHAMISDLEKRKKRYWPEGKLIYAKQELEKVQGSDLRDLNERDRLALFDADLRLRAYIFPKRRYVSLSFLIAGLLLMSSLSINIIDTNYWCSSCALKGQAKQEGGARAYCPLV